MRKPIRILPRDHKRTLAEAKAHLSLQLKEGGRCPCCNRLAKIYRRSISGGMSRVLIALHRETKTNEWIHLEDFTRRKRERPIYASSATMLRFWGLIQRQDVEKEDGNPNNGVYRITAKGRKFVKGQTTVPKHAIIYQNEALEMKGPQIGIRETLGVRFDYNELMGKTKKRQIR